MDMDGGRNDAGRRVKHTYIYTGGDGGGGAAACVAAAGVREEGGME